MTNKIFPCLWFDGKAKEAADLYCSLFSGSRITTDTPMVVNFEIAGKKIMGLNGGPMFKINPSISLFVTCESDEEIETMYNALLQDSKAMMALGKYPWSEKYGWVVDKFGMTWQLNLGNLSGGGEKITPSFLFVGEQYGKAKAAIDCYTAIFPNSQVHPLSLYQAGETQPEGNLKFGHFTINNTMFAAMDGFGNHEFQFNEGVSLVVECSEQTEIDFYWEQLIADGGKESRCGWLKDKFGVSWQIIPANIGQLMSNPEKSGRVMQAILKMNKLDIATLENT